MATSKLRQNILPFAVVILAAASLYGLPYFRYNYWETFKAVYSLSEQQMANLQTAYGLVGVFAYLVGGPIADHFSVRKLLMFSFLGTGLSGLYLLTIPSYYVVLAIHGFWGITTLMTFWPAFIKAIRSLASEDEQGRAFGIMEGLRGGYNIVLTTIPVAIFSVYVASGELELGMMRVVLYFSVFLIATSILTMLLLKEPEEEETTDKGETEESESLFKQIITVIKLPSVWLIAGMIFCAYSMNIAFYTFTPYSQNFLGMTASVAAMMTVMSQWVRPIAAPVSGFLGNKIGISNSMMLGFSIMLAGTLGVTFISPDAISEWMFIAFLLVIFFGMYSLQGNYFALLSEAKIPAKGTGTAVGVISTIGFLPEALTSQVYMLFGKYYGAVETVDGATQVVQTAASHKAFYSYLCVLFIVGFGLALIFNRMYVKKKTEEQSLAVAQ